ncbi:MAG: hypothetical protein GY796_17450 [Chloroflexi bacterium]|nr:hypothetical protein [Chloroflexota bacterium]
MDEIPVSPAPTEILCNQCTAVLPVEQGASLAVCEFCGTTNHLDKSEAVLHYVARETVREDAAAAALRRWMGGNATVKNLDKKATIKPPQFQLWPMWLVRADVKGAEKLFLKPGAAVSVLDLTQMSIPAADLEPFDYMLAAEAVAPTVPLKAVKKWLADDNHLSAGAIKETSLVHLPVYLFDYEFEGRMYTAVVDAATGQVFADLFPSKQEVPYMAIGSLGCALYFCAALVPFIAYISAGGVGLGVGLLIYLVAAVIMAVPIFAAAAYVSAKI